MGLLELVSGYIREALLVLHVYILRASNFVLQHVIYRTSGAYRSPSPLARSVLLIGDGLAEGVGDALGQGGLAPRLTRLFSEARRSDMSLKMDWRVLTAGKWRTTSADWAPGSSAASSMFDWVLVKGPFRACDAVVVFVGSHDDVRDAEGTVRNIASIAEAAVRLGKHVIVASVPNVEPHTSEAHSVLRARNEAVGAALAEVRARCSGDDCGTVQYDLDLGKVVNRGSDLFREDDGCVTLNSAGYRALAREVFDCLAPVAKRVEWVYWKARLGAASAGGS